MNEDLEQPWRLKILQDLKTRLSAPECFNNYEQAVDTTSWIHAGEARVNSGSGYVDCLLQIEWVQTTGSVSILNPDGATTMVNNVFLLSIFNHLSASIYFSIPSVSVI